MSTEHQTQRGIDRSTQPIKRAPRVSRGVVIGTLGTVIGVAGVAGGLAIASSQENKILSIQSTQDAFMNNSKNKVVLVAPTATLATETPVPSATSIPTNLPTETPQPTNTIVNTPSLGPIIITATPEPTATPTESLLPRNITRYEARGLMNEGDNTLFSFLSDPNKEAKVEDLQRVRDGVKTDISKLVEAEKKGSVKVEQFGNFAEFFLSGMGRLGVTSDQVVNSLDQAKPLTGDLDSNGKMVWKFSGGTKNFALATLYDESKKDEQQVLVGITHAGRARQVFRAMATSISIATGKNAISLQATLEANLGYLALDTEGSQFDIACWRTFNKTPNPVWGNFNFQRAQYRDNVGINNAHESDGQEDGQGVMQVGTDETILFIVRVDANGKLFNDDVTDPSTTLNEYNGQGRDSSHGSGPIWKPCAIAIAPKANIPTPVFVQPAQSPNQPPVEQKTPPPPPSFPTPMPTNVDQFPVNTPQPAPTADIKPTRAG